MIVSVAILGAALGSLASGYLSDEVGRKKTIILADVFMTLGALIMSFAASVGILVAGRFLLGVTYTLNNLIIDWIW